MNVAWSEQATPSTIAAPAQACASRNEKATIISDIDDEDLHGA
jgi:hypothetical protein